MANQNKKETTGKRTLSLALMMALCAALSLSGCSSIPAPNSVQSGTQPSGLIEDSQSASPQAVSIEGSGYPKAEDAASAYLTALKETDIRGMIGAFAVETYVDHFDFEAQLSRVKAYGLVTEPGLPASNGFTRELNIYQRTGNIAASIRYQYMTLFAPSSGVMDGAMRFLASDDDISALTGLLGDPAYPESLRSLEIVKFIAPEDLTEDYTSEANLKYIRKTALICGADEIKSIAASVKIKGQEYLFCFDAANYGGKWYLISFGGDIGVLLGLSGFSSGIMPQ